MINFILWKLFDVIHVGFERVEDLTGRITHYFRLRSIVYKLRWEKKL